MSPQLDDGLPAIPTAYVTSSSHVWSMCPNALASAARCASLRLLLSISGRTETLSARVGQRNEQAAHKPEAILEHQPAINEPSSGLAAAWKKLGASSFETGSPRRVSLRRAECPSATEAGGSNAKRPPLARRPIGHQRPQDHGMKRGAQIDAAR